MATLLSAGDKVEIINQRIRNIELSMFGIQMDLIAENAVSQPDTPYIAELNAKVTSFQSKISALEAELESLTE
jgi:capsule polysaccharide export protein KpsE/RkpR